MKHGFDQFQRPADAYDRFIGRYGRGLAAALSDFAGVEAGMRAVDVGCGPGALSSVLVERLGAANVRAVDPSDTFVEAFRTRLPHVEVLQSAAEDLPFANDTFDAALSQLVINFMRDPETGVREMARVTRPGGIVAACVWDYAGEMTFLRAFWDAARDVDPEKAVLADEGIVMPWCGEGDLARLWAAAGLDGVRFGSLKVSAGYSSFDDLWSPLPTGIGPAGAYCSALEPEGRAALKEALRRRLKAGDGPFELTARSWAVVGTVPA